LDNEANTESDEDNGGTWHLLSTFISHRGLFVVLANDDTMTLTDTLANWRTRQSIRRDETTRRDVAKRSFVELWRARHHFIRFPNRPNRPF
jgi:hypothetical protein